MTLTTILATVRVSGLTIMAVDVPPRPSRHSTRAPIEISTMVWSPRMQRRLLRGCPRYRGDCMFAIDEQQPILPTQLATQQNALTDHIDPQHHRDRSAEGCVDTSEQS